MLTSTRGLNYRQSTPPGGWLNPDCPDKFKIGTFMLPIDHMIYNEQWDVRRFHIWYMHASELGVKEFMVRCPKELFNTDEDFSFPIHLEDMHDLLRRRELDMSLITLFAM
jgi:hypothetical protein